MKRQTSMRYPYREKINKQSIEEANTYKTQKMQRTHMERLRQEVASSGVGAGEFLAPVEELGDEGHVDLLGEEVEQRDELEAKLEGEA